MVGCIEYYWSQFDLDDMTIKKYKDFLACSEDSRCSLGFVSPLAYASEAFHPCPFEPYIMVGWNFVCLLK